MKRKGSYLSGATVVVVLGWCCTWAVAQVSPLLQDESNRIGHVLNRITYGPSLAEFRYVQDVGIAAYLEEQLRPDTIEEQLNEALQDREDALFETVIPYQEIPLIRIGEPWHFLKGTAEPSTQWNEIAFDDSAWPSGPTGIGYGDRDDQTVLADMRRLEDNPDTPEDESQPGYLSVYARRRFDLSAESLAAVTQLILRMDYDDGFKAFLNGTEVARGNMPEGFVAFDSTSSGSHEAGTPEEFDLTSFKDVLRVGDNVLAVQVHNRAFTSSDLSMIPELINRERLPLPSRRVIRDIESLQQLVHVRGVYGRRQLQTVLAEFWENHFCTDYDKLVEYLDDLQNSDASDAMSEAQARAEAAEIEYQEYQFFYEHALGYFGDLLLYSATSPSMLVYLDNVLNVAGKPNENYAREILELYTFGVDNRYTQQDIVQLAKCFTGWTVCKFSPDKVKDFPASALNPPEACGVQSEDRVILDLGSGWRYFKGREEPSPGPGNTPDLRWAQLDFDDSEWLSGDTGIGYGDGDDATVLEDMRGDYTSVYLRRHFQISDPDALNTLLLEIAYDDGFVAYLNGMEILRSENMEDQGNPPAFDQITDASHEVDEGVEYHSLLPYMRLLVPGDNVLAIQAHNYSLNSSDLSMKPRLIDRRILPGSVDNGSPEGLWAFHFHPDLHESGQKRLFRESSHEITLAEGRAGRDGLNDALDVMQAILHHPSTAEFICIKLIQKFVSDRLTLDTYRDGTAPAELQSLLTETIQAWHSTEPPGHIQTIMRVLLDPADPDNPFWSDVAFRAKVKTPVEYINSSLRGLGAWTDGEDLPDLNEDMGMDIFRRNDPDGYSEFGFDWIDTTSMLNRIDFVRSLAQNQEDEYGWDTMAFLEAEGLETAEEIVDFFNAALYQDTLPSATVSQLLLYLNTDENGLPQPLDSTDTEDYQQRVEACIGLMLSLPQWHFQ